MREVLEAWYPGGDASLPAPLRQTLHALLTFAGSDGVAWVGRERLALFMGVKPQQAYRRLAELRKLGALGETVSKLTAKGGRIYGYPILRPQEPSSASPDPVWLHRPLSAVDAPERRA